MARCNGMCGDGVSKGKHGVSCVFAPCLAGVWLYSRKPVDPESTATMRGVAESLNLDISNLKPVTQVGRAQPCIHARLDLGAPQQNPAHLEQVPTLFIV